MFSFLRYIAVISLIVTIIGLVAIGSFFERTSTETLLQTTQAQHEAAIQGFTDTVWRAHDPRNPFDAAAKRAFKSKTGTFFQNQPFLKATIFSSDVTALFFGTSKNYVLMPDKETKATLFNIDNIRRGQFAHRILDGVYYPDASGKLTGPRVLVHSIVPVMAPNFTKNDRMACQSAGGIGCTPKALVEIYSDVTGSVAALSEIRMIIGGAVGVMVLLLVGVIFIAAGKAEAMIAKQHEVNQELAEAAASAEAQSRGKSEFLANISHELRTPLNAIIGFSDIIRSEASLQGEHAEHINDINNSGTHLLSLINDILDFSKAEAGKLQIDWQETDAGKLIRNSLRLVIPRAESAQVTLVEDLPKEHLVMVTDGKKLKQVLLNLLSNAVKFTPAGGEVQCAAWQDIATKNMMIQVKDTGIGISAKDISKVLSAFGQVDSKLSRKYEGTGLGLPLSKKFVEIMGGSFAIESEEGKGTTITISLPPQPEDWQGDSIMDADEAA